MPSHQFGWDLPPGVSLHHIPGNRPEDEEDEAFWTELNKQFEDHGVAIPNDAQDEEWFTRAIEICRDLAFDRGYKQGQHDEKWVGEVKRAEEIARETIDDYTDQDVKRIVERMNNEDGS